MTDTFSKRYVGVFTLILICFVNYILFNILKMPFCPSLFLNHQNPEGYQFVTSLFFHGHYVHLSGNMFFLYVFGKIVEEEEGILGLIIAFFVCGITSNLCDYFFSPKLPYSSLGASGAVFGLFTTALLLKFKPKFSSLLEVLILFPFVFTYLRNEIALLEKKDQVAHDAHLYGALAGAVLIISLKLLGKRLRNPVSSGS